jgi:mannan endo-1,4-beta-mannosidase
MSGPCTKGPNSSRTDKNPGSWAEREGQDFIPNSQAACIDYVGIHVWPDDWNLLVRRVTHSLVSFSHSQHTTPAMSKQAFKSKVCRVDCVCGLGWQGTDNQKQFIQDHIDDAKRDIPGKPFVLEEFGGGGCTCQLCVCACCVRQPHLQLQPRHQHKPQPPYACS